MVEKIVIGPINKGLRTDREPFVIDNDSFPQLINAYQWRGRILRKRGTQLLGQLTRFFNSNGLSYTQGVVKSITLNGSGIGNIISGFSLESNAVIVPGSVTIVDTNTSITYTDPTMDGYLTPTGTGGPNFIIYSTGSITIPAAAGDSVIVSFNYYPQLPVMGLEEERLNVFNPPGTIGFDTTYSYILGQSEPFVIHDVSFYKNPAASSSLPGYSPKTFSAQAGATPTTWNGQNYQQFWTTNYAGAFWATNGVQVPFSITNIGMQYSPSNTITFNSNTATTITLVITNCPLITGDFVFFNEWIGGTGLNFQTGYVTSSSPNTPALATKTVTITLPDATLTGPFTPGIVQYLTTRINTALDCIRWFDGDPTNGLNPPTFINGNGWVNYCPPLSQGTFSIGGLPPAQYYLIGAKMIVPFKDRLCFLGPVVQSSAAGSQAYLQDTIIFSQVGTPYYTVSYTNSPSSTADTPTSITNTFNPMLVPINQTATSPAMFEDQIGFGGNISAGVSDAITTVGANEDGLIVGFTKLQTRVLFTGNITPFEFFVVNSELGSGSTFSSITMDQAVLTRGNRGFVMTNQQGTQRFDLEILDQIFEINLDNNGAERFTSQRDFINEWIYFTYNGDEQSWVFPSQTLLYNYRDQSFAIFNESYTTYGPFIVNSGETWGQLNYFTWAQWNDPWNSGDQESNQPIVIAGNQQGYVLVRRDDETSESVSLSIQSFNSTTNSIITSPNHNLNNGDYVIFSGLLGTIGARTNGLVFQVSQASTNTFQTNPPIDSTNVNYFGGGQITRMYVPFIQTKQFPTSWALTRKTRLGPQQYLFSTTQSGQITLNIYLSQDGSNPYNSAPIFPSPDVLNNSLIFSQLVYTCPESTNLGLTPFTLNLNQLPGSTQAQIWHRMNTSLIGDTVQLGITLNDTQMRDPNLYLQFAEIELHAIILEVAPSMLLA